MKQLAIALICAGCFHDSPVTLSNSGSGGGADDILAMLPVDSEVVFGIDVNALRPTAVWSRFEPKILHEVRKELDEFRTACGYDPVETTALITGGVKLLPDDVLSGVIVVRGTPPKVLDCVMTQFGKGGNHTKRDHGVVLFRDGRQQTAWAMAGASTLVLQLDPAATADSIAHVMASGSPLRGSPKFIGMFDHLDHHAQLWGLANGNSRMLSDLTRNGAGVKTIDGTIVVGDGLTLAMRVVGQTPADATKVHDLIANDLDRIGGFLQRHSATVSNDVLQIDLAMTGDQIENALALLGVR